MSDEQEFVPSKAEWVRDHVAAIDAAGDTSVAQVQDRPVVVVTIIGRRSGKPRKVPLMRVEHDGAYAAFGSYGGRPTDPAWVGSIRANPDVTVMDGTVTHRARARELTGAERQEWWERGVAAYPPYADYQANTGRLIPVFVLERL